MRRHFVDDEAAHVRHLFHRSNHPLRVLELLVATYGVVIHSGTRRIYARTCRQAFASRLLLVVSIGGSYCSKPTGPRLC